MLRMRRCVLLAALLVLTLSAAARADAQGPARARGVRYLYLVRHGMYDRVEDVDDRVGNGLDALGRDQARLVAARFAALPVRIATLVCSDLTRARETADAIGRALDLVPVPDSLLRECTPTAGRAESMGRQADEDAKQCAVQLEAAWKKYVRPAPDADVRDVLVCHGNVIRWFVARALGLDPGGWARMDIGNASVTVIAVAADGTARLAAFSDVGHLPPALQTWTGRGAGWSAPPGR